MSEKNFTSLNLGCACIMTVLLSVLILGSLNSHQLSLRFCQINTLNIIYSWLITTPVINSLVRCVEQDLRTTNANSLFIFIVHTCTLCFNIVLFFLFFVSFLNQWLVSFHFHESWQLSVQYICCRSKLNLG